MTGIKERIGGYFRENPVTIKRKVDNYLTENLPRLAREYKLASEKDIAPIDGQIEDYDESISELEKWKADVKDRVSILKKRVKKIELEKGGEK
ncbi:MAG: hypothetical protein ACQEQM_07305 [Thermoplasmatota archaeon]